MREVKAANRGRWIHGIALGQRNSRRASDIEQIEDERLLGMVGLGGITWRGPDAAILFRNEIFLAQQLRLAVSPNVTRAL